MLHVVGRSFPKVGINAPVPAAVSAEQSFTGSASAHLVIESVAVIIYLALECRAGGLNRFYKVHSPLFKGLQSSKGLKEARLSLKVSYLWTDITSSGWNIT